MKLDLKKVAGRRKPVEVTYAKWADKVPGVGWFAGLLPKWPRWARILATLVVAGIVVLVIFLLRR
jgi:hypothetical protein